MAKINKDLHNMKSHREKLKIFLLYFFLIAGGLWHILGLFQNLTKLLASPLLIVLGFWLIVENWRLLKFEPIHSTHNSNILHRFLGWIMVVLLLTLLIESLGVKTGKIFGNYDYGTSLSPFIGNVPLAIGFAWISMLLSSIPIAQWIGSLVQVKNYLFFTFFASLMMTLFDFFMEPAVMKLNYWTWHDGKIPFQNYLAWFIISFILLSMGQQLKIFSRKLSTVGIHAYFAQLIYFLLVNLK